MSNVWSSALRKCIELKFTTFRSERRGCLDTGAVTIGFIYIIMDPVFITLLLLAVPMLFSAAECEFHIWLKTVTFFRVHYYTSMGLVCTVFFFWRRQGVFRSSDNRLGIDAI
jgi:hypothetical protein